MLNSISSKSKFVVILISACIIFFNLNNFPGNILSWDVFGYYAYLPMIFIYENWGLQNIEILTHINELYDSSSTLYQAYQLPNGEWILRYTMGMAILYSPFFIIGHLLSYLMGYPLDGFSEVYQTSILYGGIFYSILGFYFLRKVLLFYFSENVTAITIGCIYFGTNYLIHSSFYGQNAMSHNYLFTLYAGIIWFTIKWLTSSKQFYLLIIAFLCSLVSVARPSEIICFLIPLFWSVTSWKTFKERLRLIFENIYVTISAFLVIAIVALPQLIYWKIIAGKFIFNSYDSNPGEGFNFLNPYILEVLFSFRKGWLIYTPIMLLSIVGLFISFKQRKDYRIVILLFFLVNLYIVSSWSCWWYAESFSSRALIPSYALLSIPLAFSFESIFSTKKKFVRNTGIFVSCLFVLLNLFQSWQFFNDIIHPSRMTSDAYWSIFLKSSVPSDYEDLLLINRDIINRDTIETSIYRKTLTFTEDFRNTSENKDVDPKQETKPYELTETGSYSPSLKKKFKALTRNDHVKIKVSALVYFTGAKSSGELIARMNHGGKNYGEKNKVIAQDQIASKKWTKVSFVYLTPVIRDPGDHLKIYFYNTGSDAILIDYFSAEIYELK